NGAVFGDGRYVEGDSASIVRADRVEVDATSSFDFDALGAGRPASVSSYYVGGSYGGRGGEPSGQIAGETYGSAEQPGDVGSGAGQGTATEYGGGRIHLQTEELVLNGALNANGERGYGNYYGGGSGGSVWVDTTV